MNISVTFLGTASGGGPSETRNCSSLICEISKDGTAWMVDCAEGTIRQFQYQVKGLRRPAQVSKIFITHLHADHVMGIITFLRNVLNPTKAGSIPPPTSKGRRPTMEIYGPAGIRAFIRQNLKMTFTTAADCYVVHELLTSSDQETGCDYPDDLSNPKAGFNIAETDVMHCNECAGRNIRASEDGLWRAFLESGNVMADAGPIHHRDPCLGYIFTELGPHKRKLAILGDTHDASPVIPLCLDPSPSLLVHESTEAAIPKSVDFSGRLSKRTVEEVSNTALLRGHSTPDQAGLFAKKVGAERLVLNHIGGRFPAPRNYQDRMGAVISEIERQATVAWDCPGKYAIAAFDYLRVEIPSLPKSHDGSYAGIPRALASRTPPSAQASGSSYSEVASDNKRRRQ